MAISHPLLPRDEDQDEGSPGWAQFCLMSSYAIAAWAWRSWEFAVALLLITLYPDSLLMVSAYGLADDLVRVMLGSFIGSYIAKQRIVPAATTMFFVQNVCIGVSAASALALLVAQGIPLADTVRWTLLVVVIVIGSLSSVGSSGVRITIEVQAVVAIAAGNSERLSNLNAGFRAIDLTCLLLAPLAVGSALTFLGPVFGTLALSVYALLAWLPEVLLLRSAVRASPALRKDSTHKATDPALSSDLEDLNDDGYQEQVEDSQSPRPPELTQPIEAPTAPTVEDPNLSEDTEALEARSAVAVYLQNPVLLPTLALALLYCTVLSLGFLMTGYQQWTGLSSAEVSIYRGVGALTGLAGAAAFPWLRKTLGLVSTGQLGSLSQLTFLALGVAPVALVVLGQPGARPGDLKPSLDLVRMLTFGVAMSRSGLWIFDLTVTQLIQERVPAYNISKVCGVQTSLQAVFEMMSFVAGLYFQDPRQFFWLMLGSLAMVTISALLYVQFAIGQACCGGGGGSGDVPVKRSEVSAHAVGRHAELP